MELEEDAVEERVLSDKARRMASLVRTMVQALVDEPSGVSVWAEESPRGVQVQVRVATRDCGKVIGKQGRTARALRTVAGAASMQGGFACTVNLQCTEREAA